MGLSAGIVGLPNAGKTTIFNALTAGRAASENYPFCTVNPNIGVAAIPDNRLGRIAAHVPTQKVVPAFLELVDVPGLVKGASAGEGLGNQFLGHIKNVNAVVHIVRCFRDRDVVHVEGAIDPVRDVEIVNTELLLKDLDTVEHALERVQKAATSGDKALALQVAVLEKTRGALEQGLPARLSIADPEALAVLAELNLLTLKKMLYVANVDEESLAGPSRSVDALLELATVEGAVCLRICGKIEAEIARLPPPEQKDFLESLGLSQPGLHILAKSIFALLGLHTFFTATEKETRAWTLAKGATAQQAAGEIHSDFARGLICAEVYRLDDLEKYGSEQAVRAAGKIRQEGREYIVRDGDIIFFRFNI